MRADSHFDKLSTLIQAAGGLPAPFQHVPTAKEQGVDVNWTLVRGFYMGKNVSDADYQFYADAFAKAYKTPNSPTAAKSTASTSSRCPAPRFTTT